MTRAVWHRSIAGVREAVQTAKTLLHPTICFLFSKIIPALRGHARLAAPCFMRVPDCKLGCLGDRCFVEESRNPSAGRGSFIVGSIPQQGSRIGRCVNGPLHETRVGMWSPESFTGPYPHFQNGETATVVFRHNPGPTRNPRFLSLRAQRLRGARRIAPKSGVQGRVPSALS